MAIIGCHGTDGERPSAQAVLEEAADWYMAVADLDGEVDPDDALAVIKLAFSASDCDDFSWMLNQMTGWPVVRATWNIPDHGFGHHSLVRMPDGRLLDVNGISTEAVAARRCCRRKGVEVLFSKVPPHPLSEFDDHGDDGIEPQMKRIAGVIRCLPYAPFDTETFKVMSMAPIPGVDVPEFDMGIPQRSP